MPHKVYFDADAFRHLGSAFGQRPLDAELRSEVVLDPLTTIEILAQLSTPEGQTVLTQIKGVQNWIDTEHAGILPWMDDVIAEVGFVIVPEYSDVTDHVGEALNICLRTEDANVLEAEARRVRQLLDGAKDEGVRTFIPLLEAYRRDPLNRAGHDQIWFDAMRRRARVDATQRRPEDVKRALEAAYTFEYGKLTTAAAIPNYNVDRRRNDVLDVEHLIYLGRENLIFLTCDGGFRRLVGTCQQRRIHISTPEELRDAASAETLLRALISSV